MKVGSLLAVIALAILTTAAHAERLDCSLFRGAQAQFACYENLSRAPNPDPHEASKPTAGKAKAALTRSRKTRSD